MHKIKTKFDRKIEKIDKKNIKKTLNFSIIDGSFHSVMVGMGENYVNPFAIALNATNTQIGLLGSLPKLVSSFCQLWSADIAHRISSKKGFIVKNATARAFTWLPLFILPLLIRKFNVWLLILFFTLYYSFGNLNAPIWNSWMGDIVQAENRGKYFGKRNKATGSAAFFSMVAAGIILHLFEGINIWVGYGIIFGIALIAKLISVSYLNLMYEPNVPIKQNNLNFISFLKTMRSSNFGMFALYTSVFWFTVSIAAPFFSVYMLRTLNFSYLQYTVLISTTTVATFMTMLYWGKHSDIFGNKKIITIASMLVPVVPILWALYHNFFYLIFVQVISGFAWAGFNLSASNYVFDSAKPHESAKFFAYNNVTTAIAMFLGAMTGTILIKFLPTPWFFVSSFQLLFLISGIARIIVVYSFTPKIKELREVEQARTSELFLNLVAVKPISGLIYESVNTAYSTAKHVRKGVDYLHNRVTRKKPEEKVKYVSLDKLKKVKKK